MCNEIFEHTYYLNGCDDVNKDETINKSYALKDLREQVKDTQENYIKYYEPFRKTGFYKHTKVEKLVCMTKTELLGEKWRTHQKLSIEVSNYGRVRVSKKNILDQFEEDVGPNKYPHDGYLQVRIGENQKSCIYVYKLVIDTWVVLNLDKRCIYDIHHINNNGYDNTPENLIKIKRCQHKAIHQSFNLPYPLSCDGCVNKI